MFSAIANKGDTIILTVNIITNNLIVIKDKIQEKVKSKQKAI